MTNGRENMEMENETLQNQIGIEDDESQKLEDQFSNLEKQVSEEINRNQGR